VRPTPPSRSLLVDEQYPVDETLNAKHNVTKVAKAHIIGGGPKFGKSTMKWPTYLSTFVLNRMCFTIKSGVRTEKGFKEVHLNECAKNIFEYCQHEVSSTQV
jgi:hypothetical protein